MSTVIMRQQRLIAIAILSLPLLGAIVGCGPSNTVEIPDQPAPMPTEEPTSTRQALPAGEE
jgi:hypothetical protein